jgi:LysM repeat protein
MKLLSSRYAQIGLALIVAVLLLTALSGSAAAAGPMYHTVLPGQTLYSIAGHYGVSVWAISCANGIYNPNYIYAGQVLFIPTGGWNDGCKPAHQPPVYHPSPCCQQPWDGGYRPNPCCEQPKYGDGGYRPNPCCEQPKYGDNVGYHQPSPCCEKPVYENPCCQKPGYDNHAGYPYPKPTFGCYYTVRWGDDLFRIGLKYGVSWIVLAQANGLHNANYVYAGQVLRVPCKVW